MMRNLSIIVFTVFLIILAYLCSIFLIQHVTPNVRLDLTENKLFSLSKGSLKVIDNIQKPVELHLYYSEKEARPYPQFRQYAERVIEKIEEYSAQSNNKIVLTLIDPEPYSIAEDAASAKGIIAVPLDNGAGPLYFGLTAKSGDSMQTIGFLKPESEHFLEYELTKLIQSVQIQTKPKVLLVSDLPISGNKNIELGLLSQAWVIFRQLSERYQLTHVSSENLVIPDDIDVLWVMHPRNWSDRSLLLLQNYIESGRRAVIMLDPYAESVPPIALSNVPSQSMYLASDLSSLFKRWGINYEPNQAVLDSKYAWLMQLNENQFPKRNPALISLPTDAMNQRDKATADLDRIVLSSVGALSIDENSPLEIEPLLQSSDSSKLISVENLRLANEDPEQLLQGFVSSQESFVLAARFKGILVKTAKEEANVNFIVVADTDLLSDRLWVSENSLFGQSVFNAQASNGDFFLNIIDELSGSSELISIRSRGMVSRPFTKVDQIRRTSEQKYRDKQAKLLLNLETTQTKINSLLANNQEMTPKLLNSPEYTALIAEKIRLRQDLRRIQQELNQEVDRLGRNLKFLNIFLMPVILLMISLLVYWRRRLPRDNSRIRRGTL
jgi:ABC-type uncharacterized transport system involved in gliding motility auxiliary subunit